MQLRNTCNAKITVTLNIHMTLYPTEHNTCKYQYTSYFIDTYSSGNLFPNSIFHISITMQIVDRYIKFFFLLNFVIIYSCYKCLSF